MKKILFCLTLILIILCGCGSDKISEVTTSIISLPTTHTELTANGYRDPNLASSSSLIAYSSKSESSKATNSSNHTSSKATSTSSESPTLAYRYFASKNSTVYHIPECSSAKRIKEENLIIFENIEEATGKGYKPCSKCFKDK